MSVDKSIKTQYDTVCRIEEAVRRKVEEQIPVFEKMSAAQTATTMRGEKVLKANPAMQEIRALFRDYATIVKVKQDMAKNHTAPSDVSSIDDLRSKFRLAK